MNLYLLRHGKARESNILYTQDHVRPLTEEAIKALRRAAHAMPKTVPKLHRILTSPLLRARETAEIIAHAYGNGIQTEILEALDGTIAPEAITNIFANQMGNPSILLVGHSPNLDELIKYLVAPEESHPITHLSTGDLARVEFELPLERRAVLHWIIPLEAW